MTWTPSIVNLLWKPLSDVCRQKIIWHHGNLWKCTKKINLINIGFTKYILGSYFLLTVYPLSIPSMNLMLMLVENDENLHFNKMPTIERMDSSQSHFLSIKYSFAKIRVIVNILPKNHTSYLSFFLHRQIFWKIKFTPKFTQ